MTHCQMSKWQCVTWYAPINNDWQYVHHLSALSWPGGPARPEGI